jgi:hypothetical protein
MRPIHALQSRPETLDQRHRPQCAPRLAPKSLARSMFSSQVKVVSHEVADEDFFKKTSGGGELAQVVMESVAWTRTLTKVDQSITACRPRHKESAATSVA